MNLVGILEDTGEEVERYDNFIFQLSDQEVVQGIFFFYILIGKLIIIKYL